MQDDRELDRLASPDNTYEWEKLLLARAHFNGSLAALDAAWQRVMAYGRGDSPLAEPVELALRCAGVAGEGAPRLVRLHRRFDRHGQKIFVVAD